MLKQEQVKTPELDKMLVVKDKSQLIGEFLEWLKEQDIVLAEGSGSTCDDYEIECLMCSAKTTEQLLADYFDIDLAKCETERQALLAAVREDNK